MISRVPPEAAMDSVVSILEALGQELCGKRLKWNTIGTMKEEENFLLGVYKMHIYSHLCLEMAEVTGDTIFF